MPFHVDQFKPPACACRLDLLLFVLSATMMMLARAQVDGGVAATRASYDEHCGDRVTVVLLEARYC
jgi:hypothetical protein